MHILIADDHCMFRKGVIASLKAIRPSWVFSEAENGKEALHAIEFGQPIQILILDVAMPTMDGHEACRRIRQINTRLPIILLTQSDEDSLILSLLQLGINAYLLKNSDPDIIVEVIEQVIRCGKSMTAPMLKALESSVGRAEKKIRFDISVRDKEIIRHLSHGMCTKEIASLMHLTEASVESYRKALLRKTQTRNVAELISFVHRVGLITTHDAAC